MTLLFPGNNNNKSKYSEHPKNNLSSIQIVSFSWNQASDYQTIKNQKYLSCFEMATRLDHFTKKIRFKKYFLLY
jgi:hypothetical protein